MKICQNCGIENVDAMSFCVQCGTMLGAPQNQGWNQSDIPTASYNEIPPTVSPKNFETQTSQRNFAAPTPKSGNKKLFLIFGGIAALAILIFGAAVFGAVLFFLQKPNNPNPGPSPIYAANKSPLPNNSASPEISERPQTSFTPPIEPTKKGSFTVYANLGWQLSNIDTVSQESFRTGVDGKIDLDGVKTGVASSGVKDEKTKSRRLYPEFATGALLMRTRYADGKFSNIAAVSGSNATGIWQNYPGERGKIEFCINDNKPEKNGGQFAVTVTFMSVPKDKK